MAFSWVRRIRIQKLGACPIVKRKLIHEIRQRARFYLYLSNIRKVSTLKYGNKTSFWIDKENYTFRIASIMIQSLIQNLIQNHFETNILAEVRNIYLSDFKDEKRLQKWRNIRLFFGDFRFLIIHLYLFVLFHQTCTHANHESLLIIQNFGPIVVQICHQSKYFHVRAGNNIVAK